MVKKSSIDNGIYLNCLGWQLSMLRYWFAFIGMMCRSVATYHLDLCAQKYCFLCQRGGGEFNSCVLFVHLIFHRQIEGYSPSTLSWALINNSCVEFAVCEARNFSVAWCRKPTVTWKCVLQSDDHVVWQLIGPSLQCRREGGCVLRQRRSSLLSMTTLLLWRSAVPVEML